jgi:peptide/nickel transport system substrate-binding protein
MSFGWLPADKSPFLDERVRQAVSMSVDRDLHLDTFHNVTKFRSEGLPVETRWNTAIAASNEGWWLDPKGKDFGPNAKYFQYNLAESKKLLGAAGYPNGFETVSNYVTGPELPTLQYAEVVDGTISDLGIKSKVRSVDYLKEYVPQFRDGHGQFEGWGYMSTAGGATGGSAIGALANEYWSKGGAAFHGFSLSGKNDQSGDPQVDAIVEKARVEQDPKKRRALVFELQRYLAKTVYALPHLGMGEGFLMAWPCLGNFRVYQGGRNTYRWWVDETKPPFKIA